MRPPVHGRRATGSLLLGLVVLLPAAALAAALTGRAGPGITPQRLWTFAHLILFVFWLGADLGVVLAVRAAARADLLPAQRWRTLGLARSIDLAPRLAASLMLTVGGILTEYVGIGHPWWQMAGIVAIGPAWLGLVLLGYMAADHRAGAVAGRLEEGLRRLLIVAVPLSVAWSWSTGRLAPAPYVGVKLLLFAALMVLGLRVRVAWPVLVPAGRPGAAEPAPVAAEVAVARLNAVLPLMLAGWLLLAVAAWLGIVRPGEVPAGAAVSAVAGLRQP